MHIHKIDQLPYKLKLNQMFSHFSHVNKQSFTYRIIQLLHIDDENRNDKIVLQEINELTHRDKGMIMIDVEPEWFNQRKINFH